MKTIAMVLEKDDWKSRLPAIEEARQLVLNRYQPLAGAAGLLRNGVSMNKQNIVIHPVRKKMTDRILARIKNNLSLPPIIRAQTSQIT